MTNSFRFAIASWLAVIVVLGAAVPEAESHSRRQKKSCNEGDPNCWIKPAIRSSCDFWDTDCSYRGGRKYYHQRYRNYYSGYNPYKQRSDDYEDASEKGTWNPLYWETRFYHRRYANYRRWWRPRSYTFIERDYSYEGQQHCLRPHREVGDEMASREKAVNNVERRWAHSISYDRGAKYANLDRAKGGKINCDPTGQSRWLKKTLWTCVLTAVPCRAIAPDRLRDQKRFENDEVPIEDERIDR